jgi:transposase
MVFEKISIVKGRKYKSLVMGYRDENGKVRHKVIKYLGPLERVNKKRVGSGKRPTLKVRELNQEEKAFVEKSIKHSKSFVKDRAKIITLSYEGHSVSSICHRLKFDKKKVGEIINGFNKENLKIFERKKNPGRPRTITQEERNKIISYLHTKPSELGLHYNNWSWKKLTQFAKQNNIKISPSQIGRIIKKENIKYKTKRSKMYSTDKNFLKNIQE